MNDKYIAILNEDDPPLIIIQLVDDAHILLWCSCNHEGYCKHFYPILKAIREHINRPFYKVKYIGEEKSLLDKVIDGIYNLCFGVDGDSLLLVSNDGKILKVPFYQKEKVVFEVLEDDDDLSLSKYIESYQRK